MELLLSKSLFVDLIVQENSRLVRRVRTVSSVNGNVVFGAPIEMTTSFQLKLNKVGRVPFTQMGKGVVENSAMPKWRIES